MSDSPDFPATVYGFQRVQPVSGGEDVFVAELSPDGKALEYSSYLGGSDFEQDQDFARIVLDSSRNAYVAGWTSSTDFPVTPGAYQTSLKREGLADAFVSKISPICDIGTINPSVTICTPADNASLKSPVEIVTGAYDLTPVRITQVYVDGKKVYEAHLSALNVKLSMTPGTHRVTVLAVDVKNLTSKRTINITVTL
jgi:hypothetical protein